MSDISGFDPATTATQLATYDIAALQNQWDAQNTKLTGQQSALDALRKAMTDFQSAMDGLNTSSSGMVQNLVTTSIDGIATVTAGSNAAKGSYDIFVKQLASSDQVAYDSNTLTDDAVKSATGTLSLTVNGKKMDIDMGKLNSLSDLASAINGGSDNPGATASLVRTDGKVSLMLSSDNSGAKNAITLDTNAVSGPAIFANKTQLATASDAVIEMGSDPDPSKRMTFTSDTNSFDNIIDGVSITLNQTQKTGDTPLHINVSNDPAGTQAQVQKFVDAYNALQTTLGTLTSSGASGKQRGAFAGDAGIASLNRALNNMIRTPIDGLDMTQFGITADKDGQLSVDSTKLDDALKKDPTSLSKLFNGKDGLIKGMDKSLDAYLNNTNGTLKGRQDTLDRQSTLLSDRKDTISTRYQSSYNRYFKEFTQLQVAMSQMSNTMSMFGITS